MILVTGAAGFIGAALCERLLQDGHEVLGIDNLNSYYDPDLKLARLRRLDLVIPGLTRDPWIPHQVRNDRVYLSLSHSACWT